MVTTGATSTQKGKTEWDIPASRAQVPHKVIMSLDVIGPFVWKWAWLKLNINPNINGSVILFLVAEWKV